MSWLVLTWLISQTPEAKQPLVPPTINATIVPPEATVGDEIVLRLTVKHAEVDAFEFPLEPSFGDLELVDRAAAQKQDGPMVTEELVFKLTSYETGAHEIPKLSFRIGGGEFSTDALPVTIRTVLDDAAESPQGGEDGTQANAATDAKSGERKPDGEPFAIYERVYWPFYVAGAVLMALATWMLLRRKKPTEAVSEAMAEQRIAPHEAALVLLRLLRDKDLLRQGRTREYYFEATEILRGYLSQRYAINALDLTTSELMGKLSAISAPGLDRENLRVWLDHADLVKFARLAPPIEKGAQMVDFFEQLVWATRPPAPKSVEAAA